MANENPEHAGFQYLLGRASTDLELSLTSYRRALELDDRLARAWMGMAAIERILENLDRAVEHYRQALELDSSLSEAWIGWVAIRSRQDRQAALEIIRQAMIAVPGEPEIYLAAASMDPDSARLYLEKGTQRAPLEPRLHRGLAEAYINEGEFKAALASLDRCIELQPGDRDAARRREIVYARSSGILDASTLARVEGAVKSVEEGAWEQALPQWETIARGAPRWALAQLLLGRCQQALGQKAAAIQSYQQAYTLNPASEEVQAHYGLLLLESDPAAALPLLQSAALQRPGDLSLALALAQARLQAQSIQDGLSSLQVLQQSFPKDPRPYMALAKLYSHLGKPELAYQILLQGVSQTQNSTLTVALVAAAVDAGLQDEAAARLRDLGESLQRPSLIDAADRLEGS